MQYDTMPLFNVLPMVLLSLVWFDIRIPLFVFQYYIVCKMDDWMISRD